VATLRFRHLGRYFMKPGDFEDFPISKILHFIQGAGLHEGSIMVEVRRSLMCLPFLYSILFYSNVIKIKKSMTETFQLLT